MKTDTMHQCARCYFSVDLKGRWPAYVRLACPVCSVLAEGVYARTQSIGPALELPRLREYPATAPAFDPPDGAPVHLRAVALASLFAAQDVPDTWALAPCMREALERYWFDVVGRDPGIFSMHTWWCAYLSELRPHDEEQPGIRQQRGDDAGSAARDSLPLSFAPIGHVYEVLSVRDDGAPATLTRATRVANGYDVCPVYAPPPADAMRAMRVHMLRNAQTRVATVVSRAAPSEPSAPTAQSAYQPSLTQALPWSTDRDPPGIMPTPGAPPRLPSTTRAMTSWLAARAVRGEALSEGQVAEALGLDLVSVREMVDEGDALDEHLREARQARNEGLKSRG